MDAMEATQAAVAQVRKRQRSQRQNSERAIGEISNGNAHVTSPTDSLLNAMLEVKGKLENPDHQASGAKPSPQRIDW